MHPHLFVAAVHVEPCEQRPDTPQAHGAISASSEAVHGTTLPSVFEQAGNVCWALAGAFLQQVATSFGVSADPWPCPWHVALAHS